jgi:hypothetical protein
MFFLYQVDCFSFMHGVGVSALRNKPRFLSLMQCHGYVKEFAQSEGCISRLLAEHQNAAPE